MSQSFSFLLADGLGFFSIHQSMVDKKMNTLNLIVPRCCWKFCVKWSRLRLISIRQFDLTTVSSAYDENYAQMSYLNILIDDQV